MLKVLTGPGARVALALAIASVCTTPPLSAQTTSPPNQDDTYAAKQVPIPLQRLTGPIRLDGVVDEPAWDAVTPLEMVNYSPVFRGPPSERTEVRLAYDDEYLYVSGRMYDSDPSQIRTNTLYRDTYSGDDLLAVLFDSYNDYETALWFVVNPAGARNDRTVLNDAVFGGTMPMNSDWNAHWDVATSQTDEGWFAEFRIPFSTLKFQVEDDEVIMGLISYRFIPRRNERHLYPEIDPEWGGLGFAKPSQAQRVSIRGVRQPKPIYVTPYALGGFRQVPSETFIETDLPAWVADRDPTGEVGVDIKFTPTSNLAVDLSVNTDFAQVEVDEQQINLTRFPVFFPEKRQFFQERASTFQFSTGGFLNRLFHSRRIGLDNGEVVRIYGGGRAVGRIGNTDIGLLTMQTAGTELGSSENVGVLRVSQEVLNPYSSVGGMLTTRFGSHAKDNVAYGLDGLFRVGGDEYVTLKWAQTFDEGTEEEDPLSAGVIFASWERRKDGGFSYAAEYNRVGDDFRPGLGFQLRRDYTSVGGDLQYKSYRGDASPLRSLAIKTETRNFFRNADGTPESRSIAPNLQAEFKSGTELSVTSRSTFESLDQPFSISDVTIPGGDFWFHQAEVRLQLPRSDLFRGDFTATGGTFYDGRRFGVSVNPAWNASKHVEVGGGYEINHLEFPDRDEATTAHLVRFKLQLALDTRLSLSGFAQYNSVDNLTNFNARFRYHFREGTDLWIVFNEGRFTSLSNNGLDPRRPRLAGRTLMLKYSHALIL